LSERVPIEEYARKIHEYARRFEFWEECELAGLLAAYFNESTIFITNLSVLPSFRGAGISRRLLDQCRSMAMELKRGVLELEVDDRNIIAVGIYKKYGFEEIRSTGFTVVMRLIA
jgi:ribosomal protein S18 acetylase RimI-like enzyme